MTCTTMMPKARLASASIVLYPSRKPAKNALSAYASCGTASAMLPAGRISAVTVRMPRNSKKHGLRILPTLVRILPGNSEKSSTAAKNKTENSSKKSCTFALSGKSCSSPTVNDTVAQRGIAKKGPIVRYSAQVKNMAYGRPTLLLRSKRPLLRLMPSAATPRSGRPTPVMSRPQMAGKSCAPASCPIRTGKMRLPAPKNKPNSMLAIETYSLTERLFFMKLLFSPKFPRCGILHYTIFYPRKQDPFFRRISKSFRRCADCK